MRHARLLLLCAAFCCIVRASRADRALSHQAWSVEEGLPQASVHQIFQSRDGYLWLATEGGVSRFDGYAFKTYSSKTEPAFLSDDVNAIAETESGLWVGTASGLLNYQHSRWRRLEQRDGLASFDVLSLAAAPDGCLLVLTPRGVDRFDGARFQALSTGNDTVTALHVLQNGAVLLLGAANIRRYQDGAVQQSSDAIKPSVLDVRVPVQGLQQGSGGTVWARTINSVVKQAPGFRRVFATGIDLPRGRITALHVDRQGSGWIGTNHGLFLLQAGALSQLQTVDALRLESVLTIFEDREGNIWIGTETSGLHVLRPRKFNAEPAAAGEVVSTGTVLHNGTLWFGTEDDGVRRVRNGIAEQPVPADALTSPIILAMAHGRTGDIWVGTPDGLNRIAGKRVEKYTSVEGLPDDYVRAVVVDKRGTVWASTRRGLVNAEGSRFRTYTRKDGLGSDSVGPLLESVTLLESASSTTPDLWIGTAAGLSHLHSGVIQNFTLDAATPATIVTAIAQERDGTLWVGLHGQGLAMFTGNRFIPVHSKAVPPEVTALAVDRTGHLWLRGERQVYRIPLAALRACGKQASSCNFSPEEYGIADGLPSDVGTSQGIASIWQSADGRFWFPARKGIGVVDPSQLPFNQLPPPIVIQQMIVDEADIPIDQKQIRIGSGHHRYTFSYAALSYTLPAKNRYRYQLEGFDSHWIDGGTLRSASYTNLPPQKYVFRVEARNNDGVWNTTGVAVAFRILPPVYQTWWFSCLVVVLVLLLACGVIWLHTRGVQRQFELVLAERTRIARDVHDTLAQDLVSVALQLSLVKHFIQANNVEQASTQVDATRKLVTTGLDAVRQSIWNLRADVAENSLPARLTQLTRQYDQYEHRPQLKIGGAYRRLATRIEAEVLRIAQESLSNTYRHSGASVISVTLHYETEAMRLIVRDNGRGFSQGEVRTMQGHYGLLGMQERAQALHAQLTIASSGEDGTTVDLHVPLDKKAESLQ